MKNLRIVSLLPSATEMVCALGLEDCLVGITHECDYPPAAATRPIVVRIALPMASLSSSEIDSAVSELIRSGASIYTLDEKLWHELAPTLVLAQDLCRVCAPSGNDVARVLQSIRSEPRILWFNPKSIGGIEENLRELGNATGHSHEAEAVISSGRARLRKVANARTQAQSRPRVFCMEWMDPIYCSGHWVPEMVELAGGIDGLGRKGADSVRIEWSAVKEWAPEVLVISPCGFNLSGALEQSAQLSKYPGWEDLPAVCHDRVYAVDVNSYFARPGPRVFEGVELLAHLLHPDLYQWNGPEAFAKAQIRSKKDL